MLGAIYADGREMVWIKAQWHVQQAIEAASEQSRAGQQNERNHQFNDHQVRSQPPPEPDWRRPGFRRPDPSRYLLK